MTHPLTPREKVARLIWERFAPSCDMDEANAMRGEYSEVADAILTALASGSGDHAELVLMANAALEIYSDDVLVVGGARRIHADNIILYVKNGVDALLAENAALRAACDNANGHWKKTQAAWSEVLEATGCKDGGELVDKATRATEAERKLTEAVRIFQQIETHHGIECIPDNEKQAEIRTFLNKEAERG